MTRLLPLVLALLAGCAPTRTKIDYGPGQSRDAATAERMPDAPSADAEPVRPPPLLPRCDLLQGWYLEDLTDCHRGACATDCFALSNTVAAGQLVRGCSWDGWDCAKTCAECPGRDGGAD